MAKLTPLLRLRYEDSILKAVADLEDPQAISDIFSGFQKFLYSPEA
jgi:type I restriction enzyme R subunit